MIAGARVSTPTGGGDGRGTEFRYDERGTDYLYSLEQPVAPPYIQRHSEPPVRRRPGGMFKSKRKSKQYPICDSDVSILKAMGVSGKPSGSRRKEVESPGVAFAEGERDVETLATLELSAVGSVSRGIADVEECLSWMRPRPMDGGFLSSLARLGVEVDAMSQQWHSGRAQQHEVVEGMPLEPLHTAQASSLLLGIARNLPSRLPLRSMLDPLVQVLLRSVYREWSWVPTLADLAEVDTTVESFMNGVPFYTLVKGHEGCAESARAEAEAAVAEVRRCRATTEAAVRDLVTEQQRVAEAQKQLCAEALARNEAERARNDQHEANKKLKREIRTALGDFADLQQRLHESKEDCKLMQKESKSKDATLTDLRSQVQRLNAANTKFEEDNVKMRAQLKEQKSEIDQLPRLKEQLESYEAAEALHGVRFADRISREVLGCPLEEICGVSEADLTRRVDHSAVGQQKVVLDTVCSKLQALPNEIDSLKSQVSLFQQQIKEYRQLIPMWNQDALEDLDDAYNQDAPVHRQVFSMKDRRCFAGLGTDDNVPLYLRADGMVRHLFVSKAELEDFMTEFTDFFFAAEREHEISTESMHLELYQHMKTRFQDPEALTEFAYAFICSLEAYRDDPDFELFDLMLSGAVHPSITKDQRDMLHNLEALIRACQEGQVCEEVHHKRHVGHVNSSHKHHQAKEQVSRRVIRASLEVVFPDKTSASHDALRQALYVTIQMLSDEAKTPSPDCVYTGDLFAAAADGSQTPLVEEIRRQHVYEIIRWTSSLARMLLRGRNLRDKNTNTYDRELAKTISALDPHCQNTHAQELARIGCPDPGANFHVRDVLRRLRHGALLRPKRLWVRSEPKDVVKKLLMISHIEAGGTAEGTETKGGAPPGVRTPRRIRALKVVDNPLDAMRSDTFNDPFNLEKVVLNAPHKAEGRSPSKTVIT